MGESILVDGRERRLVVMAQEGCLFLGVSWICWRRFLGGGALMAGRPACPRSRPLLEPCYRVGGSRPVLAPRALWARLSVVEV
jgi:hypothetical protein